MKIAMPLTRLLPTLTPDLHHSPGISPAELQLITGVRLNALLCGPSAALSAALTALRPHITHPLAVTSGFAWRPPASSTATVIVENVSAMLADEQHAMLDWLDASSQPVQVICTSERSLFELVERGTFSDRLFYRLNVMYLEL